MNRFDRLNYGTRLLIVLTIGVIGPYLGLYLGVAR